MPTKTKPIVVISDTHFGCQFGLCPPEGVRLDEDGRYLPNKGQRVVWAWWQEFWGEWIPQQLKGQPFDFVINGDTIDGSHHNSVTQISHNLADQKAMAVDVLSKTIKDAKRIENVYVVRGTPAHVGESSQYEEEIAKQIGAVKSKSGQYARFDLWKRIGDYHLVHFLHHVGTTSSSAHESSAVNAELASEFVEAARWGEQPPTVIVRSHRHRAIEIRLPAKSGYVTSAVTPAWQLKTPFCYKVAGARLAPPQIGGMIIKADPHGGIYTNMFVKHISRDEPE